MCKCTKAFLCVLVLVVEFFVDEGADDVGDCLSLFCGFCFECAVGFFGELDDEAA